jgi:lipoprotein-releasing system ATP-binding protein
LGSILRAKGIFKSFPSGGGLLQVLNGIEMEVREGEITSVVGASGVGKSTLLHILGTLDRPSRGEIEIDGENVLTMNGVRLAKFRNRRLGFVFQFHHLLPEFSAWENVAIPQLIAGLPLSKAKKRAYELLGQVKLRERSEHSPSQLSGGEQQRLAVARALANQPKLVLADEPSGNLDKASSEELHNLIWELNRTKGQVFVLVTHDEELAHKANRVYRLREGVLTEEKY